MFPPFEHRYRTLPDLLSIPARPHPATAPQRLYFNPVLAAELGLDVSDETAWLQVLAGNQVPAGAEPRALAYAGHQFGQFVPRLGDGRALLLGTVRDRHGQLRDLQWKGSGRTPFSRGGDGRAPLGPVLRELLLSEAMHALGVPTTRVLSVVATGDTLARQWPEPGGLLIRVADSHLRVGTFQYAAAHGTVDTLRALVKEAITRHFPALAERPLPEQALALFQAACDRQAALVAQWMAIGFVHGVLNTDNVLVSGQTIDYGPCAFLDHYDDGAVFSSIDAQGRYAYGRQPGITGWNLARLAETLLPLIDPEPERAVAAATAVLDGFATAYQRQWQARLAAKLGLPAEDADTTALGAELLQQMQTDRADWTLTFRRLCDCAESAQADPAWIALFRAPEPAQQWLQRWRQRLDATPGSPGQRAAALRAVNPRLIPRNHRVEQVLRAVLDDQDAGPFLALLERLRQPFAESDLPLEQDRDAQPPREQERVLRTFCGT